MIMINEYSIPVWTIEYKNTVPRVPSCWHNPRVRSRSLCRPKSRNKRKLVCSRKSTSHKNLQRNKKTFWVLYQLSTYHSANPPATNQDTSAKADKQSMSGWWTSLGSAGWDMSEWRFLQGMEKFVSRQAKVNELECKCKSIICQRAETWPQGSTSLGSSNGMPALVLLQTMSSSRWATQSQRIESF